jgi:hypothetical protein
MDITMRLLKDYTFLHAHKGREYLTQLQNTLRNMKSGKETFVSTDSTDREHFDKRVNQRFKPGQKMPSGFEHFTPEEVSLGMLELTMRNHPELVEALNRPNPPAVVLDALHTDEPVSDDKYGAQHTFTPVMVKNPKTGLIGIKSVTGRGVSQTSGLSQKNQSPTIQILPEGTLKVSNGLNESIHQGLPDYFDMGHQSEDLESQQEQSGGVSAQKRNERLVDLGRRTVGVTSHMLEGLEGGSKPKELIDLNLRDFPSEMGQAMQSLTPNREGNLVQNWLSDLHHDRPLPSEISAQQEEQERLKVLQAAKERESAQSLASSQIDPGMAQVSEGLFNPDGSLKSYNPMDLSFKSLKAKLQYLP